jgi:hypothetical protein
MNRRTFFTMAGIGTGLMMLPPALYLAAPKIRNYAAELIFKELHYLKLDRTGVDQYIADCFGESSNDIIANLRWKSLYYLGKGPYSSDHIFELIKYYLLSTDFFINKMDEQKKVKYLGLYSPYRSPIPNPYSFVLYPQESE